MSDFAKRYSGAAEDAAVELERFLDEPGAGFARQLPAGLYLRDIVAALVNALRRVAELERAIVRLEDTDEG